MKIDLTPQQVCEALMEYAVNRGLVENQDYVTSFEVHRKRDGFYRERIESVSLFLELKGRRPMATTRIQRKRERGWRLPPDAVCVTRPGPFGL